MFAPKDDVTQSGVELAHRLQGGRSDRRHGRAEQALGGGFQSRLFNKIRTQRGLAYSAGANAGSGYFRPGVFVARTLTRNDSVMAALDLMREEVVRVTKEPLGDEEARIARESVENALVFNFEKPSDVVFRAAFYEIGGYPADFLQRYQEALKRGRPRRCSPRPSARSIPTICSVIVGKEKEFDRPLTSLGLPLERVDITIPPPASKVKVAAATPASLATGKGWLQQAAKLAGGSAAWSAVKTWSSEASANVSMQGQSIALGQTLNWKFPDRQLTIQKLPMGEMSQGFDGQNGWRKGFGQLTDQPTMGQDVKEEYERSLFNLFANADRMQVQALPDTKTIDGVAYHVALVKSDVIRDWQLFFAPDGKLARMEFMDKGPNGEATFASLFSDWRPLGAIQYPYANQTLIAGEKFMEATLTDAKVNPRSRRDLHRPAN